MVGRLVGSLRTRKQGSTLARLLDAAELKLVDVGARGAPPPPLRRLAPHAHLFAFEPETDEVDRLRAANDTGPWAEITVVPEALASSGEEAALYVTEHPGMSSLLRPDPAVVNRYWKAGAFEVAGVQHVPTTTLDAAAQRYGFESACFLKLDTQGTELDILRSGDELVRRSVVGLYVESLFQPFYAGQSLFADVDIHLRERGFVLVDMRPWFMRGSAHEEGSYSRRQPVWAHCLYLRDLDRAPVAAQPLTGWSQYLGLALAYEQFDLALEVARSGLVQAAYGPDVSAAVEQEVRAASEARVEGLSKPDRTALLRPSGPF